MTITLASSIYEPSYLSFDFALNGYSYQIATPEKALCDKLYTLSPVKNMSELVNLLFNDLIIDVDVFKKLNLKDIDEISKIYHSTNVKMLCKYVRRTK